VSMRLSMGIVGFHSIAEPLQGVLVSQPGSFGKLALPRLARNWLPLNTHTVGDKPMAKPKLLDLFCGAGGCARGYQQAGFYVVGVDIKLQPRYCGDEFIQADALTFPLDGFDVIHASPVCKGYTELNSRHKTRHEKLILPVKERLQRTGKPFVIENVEGAVLELPGSITLCGTMFDLLVWRHRLFESNILLFAPGPCQHSLRPIGVYGATFWDSSQPGTLRKDGRRRPAITTLQVACEAMAINWMTHEELTQAIPPAYTRYIGLQLIDILNS